MGLNYGSSTTASSGGGGGCCRCTCVKSQMAALIVLFLSLSLSFVLLILAGTAKPGSWLPMINIIAVVFLPMFILIADTIGGAPTVMHDYNEPKKAWQNFGFCFLGVVLASMLGLPLVLLHAKVIQNQDFGYWVASIFVALLGGGIAMCLKPARAQQR